MPSRRCATPERLDYKRPFDDKPIDRSRAMALYLEACRGGDKPACWIAMEVANADQWRAMALIVEANCKAGDVMSCRALPAPEGTRHGFPSAPGALGREGDCEFIEEGSSCDRVAMRRECSEGFPASCRAIATSRPYVDDAPALLARAAELVDAGCKQDIISECRIVGSSASEQQREFASSRVCALGRAWCEGIGIRALKRGDMAKARDAYERACQIHDAREAHCAELGEMYLDHKLVEPVPGRGQALVDWACQRILKIVRTRERLDSDFAGCKRAVIN